MLQRQIMYKQLQELQRRQQLQELSNTRNQNYVNQLSSLKQASGGQFSPTFNETPMQDPSGMFMVGNMMQHGGPNGLVLTPSPAGFSQTQSDISLYGSHTPHPYENSHLQGPTNHSDNLLTKKSGNPFGMATMQPSSFNNSFTSQNCNFPSDQISLSDGSVYSNPEKDLFGQAPAEGLPRNYSEQGIATQGNASALEFEGRHEDAGWGRFSPGQTSNFGMSVASDSLDPLEQKILYNTDDNSWESFSKMSTGSFGGISENMSNMDELPSLQSGSWSALMQSALEETSGNDPGVQEEWSGLSFQNLEPSNDNQPAKFNDSTRLQNNWNNRNSPNAVSPSSKPQQLMHNFNMNHSFDDFQQAGYPYQKLKVENHSESSHATTQNSPRSMSLLADYNSQQKRPSGGTSAIQTSLPLSNTWPGQHKENPNNDTREHSFSSCVGDNQPRDNFSGHEFKGAFLLQGRSTSHPVPGGMQKPYDLVNQLNNHGYSVEPVASGVNLEAISTMLDASLEYPSDNMTAPSESMLELLNKDDAFNDQASAMQLNLKVTTPRELALTETSKPCKTSPVPLDFDFKPTQVSQSHSIFPSLSMVASNASSLSSHIVNDHVDKQHPASPAPSHTTVEVPHSGNAVVAQPFFTSDRQQQIGFQMGQHNQWQGMSSQQDISSSKHHNFSSRFFRSPDSVSSSIGTSSAAPNEQHYQNFSQQDYNAKQYLGDSDVPEERLGRGSSIHEGLTDINSSTSLSSNIQKQELIREHGSEAGVIESSSLITDDSKSFLLKDDAVNFQHPSSNIGELFLSGQDSGNRGIAKRAVNAVSGLVPVFSGENKGWRLSQGGQGDQSGKALLTPYHQNFHQQSMLSQNDIPTHSGGSNKASNVGYPSQISLPMVQTWFKQYETLKNGQKLPILDPRAAIHAMQPSSEMSPGNLQDCSLNVQSNLANASQGSGLLSHTAATPLLHKQLNPPSMLPSYVTNQNIAVALRKKRKLVAFEMVPWHMEVNHHQSRLQDIRTVEISWAQAANRREEEVISEAEIVEELHPVFQAKRRLICCTQLMQQVFQPAPSVIICMDASSSCDYIAYNAARLALGDACSLTGQLPGDSTDVSESPGKTSRRTDACKFANVVEGIVCRVKKLEADLTRLDKSLSIVDIKVEAQELEKFSTINRFAKFHIRAQPSTVDEASPSGVPTFHKPHPQRFVVGHPMPKILPEGVDCISL